jgi:predicted HAD superfamily phosphohydrolase YqeG
MKDQFEGIKQDVINELPFDQIKGNNKNRKYKTFKELLESNKKILSEDLMKQDSYKLLVTDFDDIVIRLKSLKTEEELHQIIEEINEFLNI